MQTTPRASLFPFLLLGTFAATSGSFLLRRHAIAPPPVNEVVSSWSHPEYLGGGPYLSPGFKDWELCDLGGRIETLPPLFSLPKWGPAALTSSSGCSTCGGGLSFNGNPKTAGLGLALAPPNDFSSHVGQLPPNPRDHAYVMADTGEVVYSEVDFVIPGQGFDFVWHRTYRSANEFEGWTGYGWSHGAELYLVEGGNGNVGASLGDGRATDVYSKNSDGSYTSPNGFHDRLITGTRSANYSIPEYQNKKFFTKIEKNGVTWEFDFAIATAKSLYVCTSIRDTWGNTFRLDYDRVQDPVRLTQVTDTEGHVATFQYANDPSSGKARFLTQVTVQNTATDSAYGDVTIDYHYNADGTLQRVDKQNTRQSDGGVVVRPYSYYEYSQTGSLVKDLTKVCYSSQTQASYTFSYASSGPDRCTQVTDADGEIHSYAYDVVDGSDHLTQYTDPSNQRRDFVYTSYTSPTTGDRTIQRVQEYLEDDTGAALPGHYDLSITRACDCGLITDLVYPDGSGEHWDHDADGNVLQYTRLSSQAGDPNLVKRWTYSSFGTYSRMLTSSGWMRAEANPSAKVVYSWDAQGSLQSVTWPTVTTGVSTSQNIVYQYGIDAHGVMNSTTDPEGHQTTFAYAGLSLTSTKGAGTGETLTSHVTRDVMGNTLSSYGKFGPSGAWTYTVTPDGRVLHAVGPNGQERYWEYDLRGRKTKALQQTSSGLVSTEYVQTVGGVVTQTTEDAGGLNAISTFALQVSNRWSESLDPDTFGSKRQWGYGSYGLGWKVFQVGSTQTRTLTLHRDTMGRVAAKELMGGTLVSLGYDGYGRQISTTEDLPNGQARITTRTLQPWGAVASTEVKVGSTLYAKTLHFFDEANRLYKTVRQDPENVLSDRVTQLERDQNSRVHFRTDTQGGITETQWRADGRILKTVDAGSNETQYAYNDAARTLTRTRHEKDTATGLFQDYVSVSRYALAGWKTQAEEQGSAGGSQITAYSYDEAGRRTQVQTPLGATTDFSYDHLGRPLQETKAIDGNTSAVTAYGYSLGGRRTLVTDANGTNTTWTYDSFGRELSVTYAVEDSPAKYATTTKSYDTYGRLDTVTDAMGVVKTYHYDVAGRTTAVDMDKGASGLQGPDRLAYTYDAMGRVTEGKTQSLLEGQYADLTVVARSYDGFNQLKTETQFGNHLLHYQYDDSGNLTHLGYPAGSPVTAVDYSADVLGRVTAVQRTLSAAVEGGSGQAETTAVLDYEGYRETRRLQSLSDLERTQGWDSFRRPTALRYEKASTHVLLTGLSNTWDADGRITVRERAQDFDGTYAWGEVYRYDQMGRMTQMWRDVRNPQNYATTNPSSSDSYTDQVQWNLGKVYERNDVVTTPKGGAAVTQDYVNNVGYQYTQIGNVQPNLTWDDNGQMTSWEGSSYTWTALGQLAAASMSGPSTRNYTYDAFGRRVSTKVGSAETQYLYHGWHMMGAYDVGNGQWLWQEIPMNRGEGMLEHVALDSHDLDGDQNTTEYRSYAVQEDWQDTVWALSDSSGGVIERYVQDDPFGQTHTEDAAANDLGAFASQVYHVKRMHGGVVEEVTGLYDFRNRWYAPRSGGWLSRDPLFAVNLYDGLLGNPVRNRDIFGLRVYFPCPAPPNRANRGWSNGEYDKDDVDDINSALACCATIALLDSLGIKCEVSQKCKDACSSLASAFSDCNYWGKQLRDILESTRTWRRAMKDGKIDGHDELALGGMLVNFATNHWGLMSNYISASSVDLPAAAEKVSKAKCCPVTCYLSLPSWAIQSDHENVFSHVGRGE